LAAFHPFRLFLNEDARYFLKIFLRILFVCRPIVGYFRILSNYVILDKCTSQSAREIGHVKISKQHSVRFISGVPCLPKDAASIRENIID